MWPCHFDDHITTALLFECQSWICHKVFLCHKYYISINILYCFYCDLLAYKKVKSDEERSSLCLWGIIFLIILLKNTYNHLNLPGDLRPGDRILSEIPLEVSGAIIGICCTYLFTKRFRLKILFIINLCVLLVLLSSVLFPLESYMRMIFQQILDSSVILAADLFLLSICF